MSNLTAQDVANYFLAQVDEECGDSISNLKLQKLLYYAQGFNLAITGKPLFDEPIINWRHGPVVEDLYHAYKHYGSHPIPKPPEMNFDIYSAKTKELLNDIHEIFGQFSAWKLRSMTREEPPCKNSQIKDVISLEAMTGYFKTQLAG
jgi:uncharacterized phage-associated protein